MAAAGEDRGIQFGVGACFALPELHHQVLELFGGFGLEGEDELVVVYPGAVPRVVLYGIVLASYMHVLVHHALALFYGQRVPRPCLDEGIEEEVLAFSRDDVRAILEAWRVLADVDGASAEGEVRIGDAQVLPEPRLQKGAGHALESVEVVTDPPQHEVCICAETHERESAQDHLARMYLRSLQELPLSALALLLGEASPDGIQLEEHVVDVLGREPLFLRLLLT